jgi:hypothetical protein
MKLRGDKQEVWEMKAKTKKARRKRKRLKRAAKLYWQAWERENGFDRNKFWGEELLKALKCN